MPTIARTAPERTIPDAALETLRFLENSDESIVQFSADWHCLYLNPAAERMLCRSRGDLLGKVVWDEYPALVGTAFQKSGLRAQIDGQAVSHEEFYAPLDTWFRVRVVPDSTSGVLTYLLRAMTFERTHKARYLLDAGLVGLLYWTVEGGIVDANATFLQMFGYTRSDLAAGRIDWEEITPPDGRERDARSLAELLSEGSHPPFEKEYVGKNGTRVPVLIASTFNEGSRTEGVSFVVDIRVQKEAQDAVVRHSQEIITIFESMTDAFIALDVQWRCTYLNAEAERLLHRRRGDLLGKVVWDEFPDAMEETFGQEYRRAVREGVEVTFEAYFEPLDAWFEVRAYPTLAGGLSVYFQNVNARWRAEQEREALIARQRQFLREMVFSLTEGKFRLCLSDADLPKPLASATAPALLTVPTLGAFRKQIIGISAAMGFAPERTDDVELSAGEAAMNAATHGHGGEGWICTDPGSGTIQIWVRDNGGGISEEALPRVMERGVSTGGTLGFGFSMMLRTCDRIYLLTGPAMGTTVVLEKDRDPPAPEWMKLVA